ncbi:MAG TPA: hypothetical protein VM146_16545 [Steroidobacteraceae bacterium]|nr:hypothetical protein [Steroidobacteraceae bacterium]
MKQKLQLVETPTLAQHDYRPAVKDAVNWLGNRYLLAEPVTKRAEERKPFYAETRHWHPATRH